MVFEEALPELKSGGIIGRSKWGFELTLIFMILVNVKLPWLVMRIVLCVYGNPQVKIY